MIKMPMYFAFRRKRTGTPVDLDEIYQVIREEVLSQTEAAEHLDMIRKLGDACLAKTNGASCWEEEEVQTTANESLIKLARRLLRDEYIYSSWCLRKELR